MNVQISDSWLNEFLETKANPEQIRESLSLCSQSVEKIIKEGDDFVYDIEITTNRPDCLSVYGIARELSAALPRFGIDAKLKELPKAKIPKVSDGLPLEVKITKKDLSPRFTAIIFENVKIASSPKFAQKRLVQSGIRALNNVIDISNYLMLELGQPMHTFDYDKILKHKMILRESKEGEEIVTLDGQKRKLKDGIIIIEDGEGRIVDLCGIMGAKNSETDENTKRVLLFVQAYNPIKIRKATQLLNFRTEAAGRFERGTDIEGVLPAIERASLLFAEWCGARVSSKITDIYPDPPKEKKVAIAKKNIDKLIGLPLELTESNKILESLGFKTKINSSEESIVATVPHWRTGDIEIPEDLVEEIARIYGYHNIPSVLPPIAEIDYRSDVTFYWEDKIKTALKFWGYTETASYSLVGEALIDDSKEHLKLSNPLTEDLLFLRTSLVPSLLEVVKKNQTEENIDIFEMANVYFPQKINELPKEIMTLTVLSTGDCLFKLKGIWESLMQELGVEKYKIDPEPKNNYNLNKCGKLIVDNVCVGTIGQIKESDLEKYNIKKSVTILNIETEKLIRFAKMYKKYTPLAKYPPIIEDLSFEFPPQTALGPVLECVRSLNPLISNVSLVNLYKNTRTIKVTYQDPNKNLSDKDILKTRNKIITSLETKFNAKLRAK